VKGEQRVALAAGCLTCSCRQKEINVDCCEAPCQGPHQEASVSFLRLGRESINIITTTSSIISHRYTVLPTPRRSCLLTGSIWRLFVPGSHTPNSTTPPLHPPPNRAKRPATRCFPKVRSLRPFVRSFGPFLPFSLLLLAAVSPNPVDAPFCP
jgi:hypothetical protein